MLLPLAHGGCKCGFVFNAFGKCATRIALQHTQRVFCRCDIAFFAVIRGALGHDDRQSFKLIKLRRNHVRTVLIGWFKRSANSW